MSASGSLADIDNALTHSAIEPFAPSNLTAKGQVMTAGDKFHLDWTYRQLVWRHMGSPYDGFFRCIYGGATEPR
jgi:hypothetical protein